MAMNWTEFPARVELFGDLFDIYETLAQHRNFNFECFPDHPELAAYTVERERGKWVVVPRAARMPGLERLLSLLESEGHYALTLDLMRELRRRTMNALKCDRSRVNAMTINEVANALDPTATPGTPPSGAVLGGGTDPPNPNLARAEAEYAAELERRRLANLQTRQRHEIDSLVQERFVKIASRWRDFVQPEPNDAKQQETLDGLLTEFGRVLSELSPRLRDDEFATRWRLADHDQNFSNYRGAENGTPWRAEDNAALSRARYDEAVRIVSTLLAGTFQPETLRPAMERLALRGVLTYLEILLKGLVGLQRLDQQPVNTPPLVPASVDAHQTTKSSVRRIVITDDGSDAAPLPPAPRPIREPIGYAARRLGDPLDGLLRRATALPPAPAPPEPPAEQIEAAALRLCEVMAGDEFGWSGDDGERLILVDVAQRGPGIEPSPFNRAWAAAHFHAVCWLFRAELVTLEMISRQQVKKGQDDQERDREVSTAPLPCLKTTPQLWNRRDAGRIFNSSADEAGAKPRNVQSNSALKSAALNNALIGGKADRKEGGRPKLGVGPNATPQEKALRNVYDLIRAVHKSGSGPSSLFKHFRNHKDFRDRVKEAGKDFDESLFKNALAWIKENPDQETESGNVS